MPRAIHRDTGKREFKAKERGLRGAKAICTEGREALGPIEPRLASRTRVPVEGWARS